MLFFLSEFSIPSKKGHRRISVGAFANQPEDERL